MAVGRITQVILSLLFFGLLLINGQRLECKDSLSCANDELGNNYTSIKCSGFQSCINLQNTIISVQAQCFGSQSCMNITMPYLDVGTLYCNAYESCMNSNFLSDGDIYCYGEKSCKDSSIEIYYNSDDVASTIDCNGALSCAKTTFKNNIFSNLTQTNINGYDSFSLYNSTINSTNGPLNLKLYGYYAGWNLTVICGKNEDYPCNVECYGTGCYNSKILCINDDYCSITCNNTGSNFCPLNVTYNNDGSGSGSGTTSRETSILNGDYTVHYENNHNVSVSLTYVELTNNENYCVNSTLPDTYFDYCNNELECYNETLIDNNNVSICCHGYDSCKEGILRTNNWKITNSENKINALIRCDGDSGCESTTIVSNNTIECGGFQSCQNAGLDTADKISCNGYFSCLSSSIADANELICNSYWSCKNADIQRIPKVYGFGYRTFDDATIRSSDQTNMTLDVYMCSYATGYQAEICCYSGDICNVYCSSIDSCHKLSNSTDDGCDGGTINYIYNETIAAQECQVYLKINEPIMSNFSMNFSTTMEVSTTMMIDLNDTGFFNDTDMSTTEGSSETGGTENANDNGTIEIVLIVVVSLIVIAVSVGLVLYFMKNRNMKRGVTEEKNYQLLDQNK